MSVSDSEGRTIGGHVMDGNIVYTTLVVDVEEPLRWKYHREFDPTSDYDELVIDPRRPRRNENEAPTPRSAPRRSAMSTDTSTLSKHSQFRNGSTCLRNFGVRIFVIARTWICLTRSKLTPSLPATSDSVCSSSAPRPKRMLIT